MDITLFHIVGAGAISAAAGGLLGSFALLRRMALVGDALSHVALPGIALGLLFHFNPFVGSLAFLVFGTTLIWAVEHKTNLPVDTLVGVLFVLALAVGALLTPEHELLEALFGDISQLSATGFWVSLLLGGVIIVALLMLWRKLTLTMISSELSKSTGIRPHVVEFFFLTLFAFVVALGITFTGVLLIGALVIIPAAIARNIATSMGAYMFLSALIGVLGATGGILASYFFHIAPGPAFVILLGTLFFLSVIGKLR
jgi:ABC-type Mn2+/Zn2+ transport system permease subunit